MNMYLRITEARTIKDGEYDNAYGDDCLTLNLNYMSTDLLVVTFPKADAQAWIDRALDLVEQLAPGIEAANLEFKRSLEAAEYNVKAGGE